MCIICGYIGLFRELVPLHIVQATILLSRWNSKKPSKNPINKGFARGCASIVATLWQHEIRRIIQII